jgi:ferredoxin
MHVSANKDTCVVSSLCVYRAPSVFTQDEDGQVEVLDEAPEPELYEDVRTAARGCPTKSIRVVEADGTVVTSMYDDEELAS